MGIQLGNFTGAHRNLIKSNIVTKNRYGIFVDHSHENLFYGNVIIDNAWNGVELAWSNSNVIQANTVSYNNAYGLEIYAYTPGYNNRIFNNNFINNTLKVSVSKLPNVWNNGYPAGGNYWSTYEGSDEFSGPGQNVSGADRIGDKAFVLDSYNEDPYPMIEPFILPAPPLPGFGFFPEWPHVYQEVTFQAFDTIPNGGEIINYDWNFGDGVFSNGVTAIHAYSLNRTFVVLLNVTDSEGLWNVKARILPVFEMPDRPEVQIEYIIITLAIISLSFVVTARHFLKVRKHPLSSKVS